MELKHIIKALRLELGFTLLEVANYLGVSEATAQRYESGAIKNLKQESIAKLSEILKVSPAFILGFSIALSPAERIKYARLEAGLSKEQLAKKMEYHSANAIDSLEEGYQILKHKDIDKLAEALETSSRYLLGGLYDLVNNDGYFIKSPSDYEDDWTSSELQEIENFKSYLKSKRQK